MSEEADNEDKKHDPSERALQQAADRGEMPRSTEVNGVASALALAFALTFGAGAIVQPITALTLELWAPERGSLGRLDLSAAHGLLIESVFAVALAAAVPLVAAGFAAVIVGLAQTRFQIAPKAFEAKLDQLDPIATFQRLYMSRQPLVELAKGSLHVGALGAITAFSISGRIEEIPRAASLPPDALLALLLDLGRSLVVTALPAMLLLAALDYGWSSFTFWQSMRRTDQQVKEEHKEQEGDPHFRAARKRRMREIAANSALKRLKEADVLVTNPTHIAIGLRYRHGVDRAPVVVLKAVDHLAVRLRKEAFSLGIPRVEDRTLARALHASVPRGRPVPASLYGPVARVLAVVYRRRKKAGRKKS